MFFPKEFTEENDYIDAMLMMVELSEGSLHLEKKDTANYKEIIVFCNYDYYDEGKNNSKLVFTFSKKTNILMVGYQCWIYNQKREKMVFDVKESFYSYKDSYMNILNKTNILLGEMFKNEKNN